MWGRLLAAAAATALTVGAVALGVSMRSSSSRTPNAVDESFVPVSRGVQEGRSAPILPKGRYWFQNHWLDVDARGETMIHAYAGALAAKPCTGVVVLYRSAVTSPRAWPPGRITENRFPGIGPVRAVSSVGMTVRLASAEGDHGVLVAETGEIAWRSPQRRRDLTEAQCANR